jgi:1,4-dihydroxy-2-naphthoate octaprenyltransferase
LLPLNVALSAARVCAILAILAIVAAAPIEPAMSAIGALALLGGWFYSAPPARLVASGFGELTTALIVAFLAPLSGLVMQRGPVDARLVAITLPLVLMQMAMLIVIELPDLDADARAGKRTLAVRAGRARAAHLHSVLLIAAFAATWIAAATGWIDSRIPLGTLLVAPLAAWQFAAVLRHSYRGWRAYGVLAAGGVALFTATAAATFAGLVIG